MSVEELIKFNNLILGLEYENATILGNPEKSTKEIRSSKIKWIPHTKEWDWIYHKFQEMITEANDELWKFDIHDVLENIQYTEYHATDDGHYDWHQDIGPGNASLRKI